ncbi:hypothetical protein [Saccharothrix sp. Mg75]|uniref:hypothetical protein n=1 Tax=Saccharothrix sp. Mg75 TaxID=3445357 RepID=UPI003EEE767F
MGGPLWTFLMGFGPIRREVEHAIALAVDERSRADRQVVEEVRERLVRECDERLEGLVVANAALETETADAKRRAAGLRAAVTELERRLAECEAAGPERGGGTG